jgi:hypothetical protein
MNIRGFLVSCVSLSASAQIALENLPLRLEAPHTGSDYQWSLGGRAIPGATNRILEIPSAQEADAGTYKVESTSGNSALFKVRFQRNIRVSINGRDVIGDRISVRLPATLRLSSPLGAVPIRYTLDGSEPLATSTLYEKPVLLTNHCVIRAAIVIPEGDSVRITKQ